MLQLCKPNAKGEWVESPDKLERLYEYCIRDVDSEAAIWDKLEEMPESELRIWQLDQKVNFRGLRIDTDSAFRYSEFVQEYRLDLQKELQGITQGKVRTAKQVVSLKSWLTSKEVQLPDLTKATVTEAMESDIDPDARRALEIRQELSAASTGKLDAMLSRTEEDGRLRGNLIYHGAATGRWAGTGIQIQNFPRGSFPQEEVDIARDALPYGKQGIELLFGNPIEVAKSSLRSMITSEPGNNLFVCDYASIEARVLAWMARQDDLVQEFRDGVDVYVSMASAIYGCPKAEVNKDQRMVGKIAVLGLGYQMGAKTFKLTCANWGVPCKFSFAKKVVKAYRAKYDKIKQLWSDINSACLTSVANNSTVNIGRLKITSCEEWMRVTLPNKREIMYAEPGIEEVQAPWTKGHSGNIRWEGEEEELFEGGVTWEKVEGNHYINCTFSNAKWLQRHISLTSEIEEIEPQMIHQIRYRSVVGQARKWLPTRTYGGKLTENIVQGIARDFLAEAMLRVDSKYPIVATVHDEIISEAPENKSLEEFERLMEIVPEWGSGCPIAVEGYKAKRYRK
jgi:DNA polymerase